ncbi:MAG: isochorismatase family protein [Chloroflexota bacterium]
MTTTARSWEPYLTERDKEHIEASNWAKTEPFGFGRNPVLLVIDDYYNATGFERLPLLDSVKKWPSSMGLEGWEAIDNTAPLIRSARENKVPVIYVTAQQGVGPWHRKKDRREWMNNLPEEQRSRLYDIVDEIAPQDGELVLYKSAPSAFQGTPLVFQLNYLGADTVIACGESTSGCVRASVVDGCTYRYRMGVVEDCTFDRTQASHYINLFDMNQKYADVVSLDEATGYFDKVDAA